MDLTSYLLGKEAGGGGETPTLQSKEVEITENGQTTVTADSGYDGLSSVAVTTNVSGGGDLSEYFNESLASNTNQYTNIYVNLIKKVPDFTVASNVTELARAFDTSEIEEVGKITSEGANVKDVSEMFRNCRKLTKVNFSSFNSSGITNIYSMFYNCSKITKIDLSSFGTINTTMTNAMFYGCSKLEEVDLRNFNSPNLESTNQMFSACRELQHIDIRNMTFDNVTNSISMFNNVPNNCEIIVKDDTQKTWITSKFSNLTNVKTVAEL